MTYTMIGLQLPPLGDGWPKKINGMHYICM